MTPQELRTSLLRLACKGFLVEQNSTDDVSQYLKETLNLSSENIFKTAEAIVELPDNWVFVKFGDLCDMSMGQTVLKNEMDESGDPIYSATIDDIPLGFISHSRNKIRLTNGDFVIPARGNSIGFVTKVKDSCASGTQTTICVKMKNKDLTDFVYIFLMGYKDQLFVYNGAAIPQITVSKIKEILVPIPPIEEQKRIVAKIEELMPLVGKYESSWNKLEHLNNHISKDLEKSILQFAMEGKLVEHKKEEGTGRELLAAITKSNYQEIPSEDYPFEIPDNWVWCRLGDISSSNIGLTYSPSDVVESGGTLVLRSSNIQNGKMSYLDNVYVSCAIPESSRINKGDLLICARNGSRSLVGKCAIVDRDGCSFGAFMAKLSSPFVPFIKCFLDSPCFRKQLDGVKTETINQITQKNLKQQLFPLPPLGEQKRIVAKIEELLSICNKLSTR